MKVRTAGGEIPQLYIRGVVSSVIAFEQSLRGFDRIHLKPGGKKTVTFTLPPDYLALLDRDMKRVVEPGTFEVQVGASSADIRLRGEFEVVAPAR